MPPKVYFIPVSEQDTTQIVCAKFSRLLAESNVLSCVSAGNNAVVKIHFGEEGNTGYIKPEYVGILSEEITSRKAACIVSDTNTLYRGQRMNSRDHLALAYAHGFKPEVIKAEVVIPDDTKKENCIPVEINKQFIKSAKIARIFFDCNVLIGMAHFKGHLMTGFGGALKNIGMGCATREGKLAQHSSISPFVIKNKCTGCAACVAVCPAGAIEIKANKSCIENSLCIGCASCIAACTYQAIEISWEQGGSTIQEKMVEYALAVLQHKKDKTVCINFATKITKECDCLAKDDPRISPDIGIFASVDPVALDHACVRQIIRICGKDIFKEAHPKRNWEKQLRHAAGLGLGSLDYELVELSWIKQ